MALRVSLNKPSKTQLILTVVTLVSILMSLALILKHVSSVNAASKNDWIAGNIISDAVFTDNNGMSVAEIQAFLDKQIGTCDTQGSGRASEFGSSQTRAQYAASRGWHGPPYTCLNIFYEVPKKTPSAGEPANNYSNPNSRPNGSQSAAWIIKDAANTYRINPKVLLVKIATESPGPLTSDKWPLSSQYKYAMGARCPDSGPNGSANCDTTYAGFSIQMYEAARLMRWYLDSMDQPWWSYKKPYQSNNILWNVAPSNCGGSNVFIENKATAALYTYTPYQPNEAALNNMYGTGDRCSAYGNRNFWRVYWDWFGQTRTNATIYTKTFNSSTDVAGSTGRVGFSLSQRPVAEVVLVLTTSNDSLIGFQNNAHIITIKPENWNKPDKNTAILYAKKSDQLRASNVYIQIRQIGSPDINFSYIDPASIGKPSILWQPVDTKTYRLFSQSQNKHMFTSRDEEISGLQANGYTMEGAVLSACPAGESNIIRLRKDSVYRLVADGSSNYFKLISEGYVLDSTVMSYARYAASVPVYELRNGTNYIYTRSQAEADTIASEHGYSSTGVAFYTCPDQSLNPVYRLFSQSSNSHFYTRNPAEKLSAQMNSGYTYEAVQFYTNTSSEPVYRFFSQSKKAHFFTIGEGERSQAQRSGYVDEGVAFYASKSKSLPSHVPTYRLYNHSSGKHFFTTSLSERNEAEKHGFVPEGIAWYQ